ncbi:MAG: hypothetical protein N2606_01075 [Candidatus Omnitrophica bacterium]|nr:hypothetical protein [Candidatus Omnitrophota bacterium]
MIKLSFLTSLFVVGILNISFAHSPSSISATVNEGTVDVVVEHSVANPSNHYVKLILIKVNQEEVGKKEFSSQESNDTQTASFEISGLKPADEIEISAFCSRIGSITKTIVVE